MPLITCPDCHYRVSDSAHLCVNCGRPMMPAKTSYIERLSEIEYQSLQFWVYLGAVLVIIALGFKLYAYLFGG